MDEAIFRTRNLVVSRLGAALEIPITLSDEQDPVAPPPYAYYTLVSPFLPTGEYGIHTLIQVEDPETGERQLLDVRAEYPEMFLSFTFCSSTRKDDDGREINGESEALRLAGRAAAWLVHEGAAELATEGLAVLRVSNFATRSAQWADEYVRRWGFDVHVRYKAQTVRLDGAMSTGSLRIYEHKEE